MSNGEDVTTDPEFAAPAALAPSVEPSVFTEGAEPAVSPLSSEPPRRASTLVESPVRTVAVLDRRLNPPTRESSDAPDPRGGRRSTWLMWLIGFVVLGLLVFGVAVLLTGGDAVTSVASDLDASQVDRVRDLEAGGLDEAAADEPAIEAEIEAEAEQRADDDPFASVTSATTSFGDDDLLVVGQIEIINGAPLLRELAAWHQEFAAATVREVPEGGGCWFGELGGNAVQEVHCGPVGGAANTEYLFDVVPVVFEDAGDGLQLAVPVIDAVVSDAVLPNSLELVGPDDMPFAFDNDG